MMPYVPRFNARSKLLGTSLFCSYHILNKLVGSVNLDCFHFTAVILSLLSPSQNDINLRTEFCIRLDVHQDKDHLKLNLW